MKTALKTNLFTTTFTVLALILYIIHPGSTALPLSIFYLTLLINTYFSINFFSTLTPPHLTSQRIVDSLLVIIYFILPLNYTRPIYFWIFATALFLVAIIKYTLLFPVIDKNIITKKIIIDSLGAVMCALTLGASYLVSHTAGWIAALAFAVANIYLLAIKPMYKL